MSIGLAIVGILPGILPSVHAQVSCGQTITTNEVLTQDLSCSSGALTFAASVTFDCQGHKITGNGFYANGYGGITIKNCIVQFNGNDVDLENNASNKVVNCTLTTAGGNYGIFTRYSDQNSFVNNTVTGGYNGFWLVGSSHNNLTSNKIFGNFEGVYITGNVIYSSFNLLQNNTVHGNSIGLDVDGLSSQNTLKFNQVTLNTQWGIYVQDSNGNNITSNIDQNNTAVNLQMSVSNNNNVLSNTFRYSQTGIVLGGSSRNAIQSNIVTNNGLGINAPGPIGPSYIPSDNNSIYNNIFRNTVNANDLWNNYWNTTKTLGKNIIGGPYIGGNYWSDYNGTDINQDYLGDTLLPYNSVGGIANGGDYHPLVPPAGFLDYKGVDPTAISLVWGQSYQLDFANYQLQKSTSGSLGPWTTVDTVTTKTNTTDYIGGLTPSATYWWRLRDFSTNGTSFSLNIQQVTQSGTSVLVSRFVNSNTLRFNWTNTAQYGGQLRFKAYTLMESVSGGNYFPAISITIVSNFSIAIYHLTPSTNYSFKLVTTDYCKTCTGQVTSNSTSNTISVLTPDILTVTAKASQLSIDTGQAVTFTCQPTGGTAPYLYSWNFGDGGTASSQIAGHIYTFQGTDFATCRVVDAVGNQTTSQTVTITVDSDPIVAKPSAQPSSVDAGQTVVFSTSTTGGSGGYSYYWTGLPPGCVSSNSPTISCLVTSLGTYNIVAASTDSNGLLVYSTPLTFTPTADPIVVAFTASPSSVDLSNQVTFEVTGTGGNRPLQFIYSGLPPGCQTTNSTTITCTPTTVGVYSVTVNITDSNSFTVTSNLSVRVNPALVLTSFQSSALTVDTGQNFTMSVSSTGGTGPFSYAYSGLPVGCRSVNSFIQSCFPSRSGNYTITSIITDTTSATASASIMISVDPDPRITSFTTPSNILTGQQLQLSMTGQGGTGTLSYSYTGLPPGCVTMNSPSISCSPTSSGTYRVTAMLTDANGMTDTTYTDITITQPILGFAPAIGYGVIAGIAIAAGTIVTISAMLIRQKKRTAQT